MIQANELRIGNWIMVGIMPTPFSVFTIEFKREIGFLINSTMPEDHLRPIPLTSETLEKCGCLMLSRSEFVYNRYSIRKEKKLDNPCWEFYLLGNDTTFHWIKNFHFLHEFQNLIYSLTGEELKIEL